MTYFGTWHIVDTFLTSFGLFDILTFDISLKPPQPIIGLFFLHFRVSFLVYRRCTISSSLWISVYFDCMWTMPNSDICNVSIDVLQFLGHEGGHLWMDPLQLFCECFVLLSPVFRSYTIKAVQKLMVCILPVQVLFSTISSLGQYWWLCGHPNSITVYKINSFSTFESSAQIATHEQLLSPPKIKSLNTLVELTGGWPHFWSRTIVILVTGCIQVACSIKWWKLLRNIFLSTRLSGG